MSDQFYRIEYRKPSELIVPVAVLPDGGVMVPVEAYEKHEVCICLMSEGFDPQPPQRIHNNWCTYVEPKAADDE